MLLALPWMQQAMFMLRTQLTTKIRFISPPASCSPGTFVNTTTRTCTLCRPGTFSSTLSALACSPCPAGSFAQLSGATSCSACPAGHYCLPGAATWKSRNCGKGSYCPEGSAAPIPCPFQVPPGGGSWASTPQQVQGPAFLVDTAACLSHCYWVFPSGSGSVDQPVLKSAEVCLEGGRLYLEKIRNVFFVFVFFTLKNDFVNVSAYRENGSRELPNPTVSGRFSLIPVGSEPPPPLAPVVTPPPPPPSNPL